MKNTPKTNCKDKTLLPFIGSPSKKKDAINGIHFSLTDYFELTEWVGQVIRDDKRGYIPPHIQPILQKLGVQEANWVAGVEHFGRRFGRFVGPVDKLKSLSDKLGQWWIRGTSNCRCLYADVLA